ncbi:MAG: SMI1/KNR4 family protein [Phenylobacterium sp.]|uniref:SMI1/KNR4 family protein n=1 Tax=Phenylobacterium sp. TaxID=1871053 RepID=UPI001A561F17|nr:SMI1/KNR4 family protein [Phenylobacterium sp.]MBL8556818.1 SMI1/KNR4 family protein [Phenylobacterium sp.]
MTPSQLALQRFATKWGDEACPPATVDPGDLAIAEYRIGRLFPAAYHDALVAVGLPNPTASLLASIVEADADFGDVSAFLTPADIVAHLDAFRTAATPDAFVAFAADSMGDRYGFLCPRSGGRRPSDGPVLRMNHETGETEEAAASFLAWLLDYADLAFVRLEEA